MTNTPPLAALPVPAQPRNCSARWFFKFTAKGLAPRTEPRSMGSLNVFTKVA